MEPFCGCHGEPCEPKSCAPKSPSSAPGRRACCSASSCTSNGIDNIILERQTGEYVLGRIRAGVIEAGHHRSARRGRRRRPHAPRRARARRACRSASTAAATASRLQGTHRQGGDGLRPDRDHQGSDGRPRRGRRAQRSTRPTTWRCTIFLTATAACDLSSRRQVAGDRLRLHRRLRRLSRRQPPERPGRRDHDATSGSIRSAGSAFSPTRRRSPRS